MALLFIYWGVRCGKTVSHYACAGQKMLVGVGSLLPPCGHLGIGLRSLGLLAGAHGAILSAHHLFGDFLFCFMVCVCGGSVCFVLLVLALIYQTQDPRLFPFKTLLEGTIVSLWPQ